MWSGRDDQATRSSKSLNAFSLQRMGGFFLSSFHRGVILRAMSFQYKSVVPWGRSYEEYLAMFGLTQQDLAGSILGCGDGPAGFNCVMHKKGKRVVSADPLYRFTAAELEKRIEETSHDVISQTRRNTDKFVWVKIKDVDELARIRMSAMKEFLADFETGKKENRYVDAELPLLPFADGRFDLALSSHFLLLYSDHLSLEFHFQAITEMLRVAREVRIFPILDLNGNPSPYTNAIGEKFESLQCCVSQVRVDYEFQKNGNQMLTIKKTDVIN
jgi:hypothetical protein